MTKQAPYAYRPPADLYGDIAGTAAAQHRPMACNAPVTKSVTPVTPNVTPAPNGADPVTKRVTILEARVAQLEATITAMMPKTAAERKRKQRASTKQQAKP